MVWTHSFASLYRFIIVLGLPLVQCYHLICGNIFLNTAAADASRVEYVGNLLLAPAQYLLSGQEAIPTNDPDIPYYLTHKFDYGDYWQVRTVTSLVMLPASIGWGSLVKGLSYFSGETRQRHAAIKKSIEGTAVQSNNDYYRSLGIAINEKVAMGDQAPCINCRRRKGEENSLSDDKAALKEIVAVLEANNIPYWADCGTCLGAYRYGGAIPWDNDIDIAILRPDFDNVKRALNALDPKKYIVQDWSSRDKPKTLLKVWAIGKPVLVDIYNYEIEDTKGKLRYIVSNIDNIFLPESWRARERKYTVPVDYDMIFPLKRARFDGIEVAVPNKSVEYLKVRYGENLDPIMVYNPETDSYEQDSEHPYWQFIQTPE